MGSRWTVRLDCDDQQAACLTQVCAQAVEGVEQQMSHWRKGSDLNRLNAAALGEWVALPAQLMTVLDMAAQISRASGGVFDVGVGELVQAWGFGPAQGVADPQAISGFMGKAIRTHDALDLDMGAHRARKAAPMTLDLSGIAKGYGVDVLAAVLADHGVTQCLCGLDGELVARGLRPDGKPWAVALEQPDPTRRAGRALIELTDRAIATSGSYRHFVTLGNLRVSHTMNPRTGGPAVGALVSVSVLHDSCMQADAWATVLMVLGDQAGPEFAKAQGLQAIFLAEVGGEIRETLTGFAPA